MLNVENGEVWGSYGSLKVTANAPFDRAHTSPY